MTVEPVLYVEKFTEAYTGRTMVGVGGRLAGPAGGHVEVAYDGVARSRAEVKDGAFATQLPLEPRAERVTVRYEQATLYDGPLAAVPRRGADAEPPPGLAKRVINNLLDGGLLSPARWAARWTRLRLKLRAKSLARRHRRDAPHAGYVHNTEITPAIRAAMARQVETFTRRPKISILMPVYNVDPRWLTGAVESVRGQIYGHWELCIADDASTDARTVRCLESLAGEPRIKITRREHNGHICAASNDAADLATGEFIALLDNDDRLAPDALYEIARLLQDYPDADVMYSDEDKIDEHGRRYDPQFKPDWSPGLFLSYNYVNHFTCVRRSLFEKVGRFRPGFEGAQDFDLLQRAVCETERIHHIPRILYHWRSLPGSTATAAGVKPYVADAWGRGQADLLRRRGVRAETYVPEFAERLGLPVRLLDRPDTGPGVTVIVDTADDSVIHKLKAATAYRDVKFVKCDGERNRAALAADEYVMFLDGTFKPADPRWLSRLLAYAELPGVGAAGPRVDAGGAVWHAGVVLGQRDGTAPANAFHGHRSEDVSYYFYAEVARDVAAVSGRCLLTRRDHFARLHGFDLGRYPDTLWDVDYCLRLAEAGLRTVYVGDARLACRESQPDRGDDPQELLTMRRERGRPADPYYNPNLSEGRSFRVACDAPLPDVPAGPPVRTLVASHNMNNPEGAPRYLYEIVLGLRRRGLIEPTMMSPRGGKGEAAYAAVNIPVDVLDTSESPRYIDGMWTPGEYAAAQKRLAALINERGPGAVLVNTLLCFPAVEAAAAAGVPAVWVIHESYSPEHMARLFSPFGRARCEAAFALAARVVPASHDTAALFARLDRGNVHVIHNGLIAADFQDHKNRITPADGRKRIINVGTVCERKGQHTLVEAAAILKQSRSDFLCQLVGTRDGVPYADYVRHLVAHHGLGGVVELVPETDRVREYYRAADVFVCTSHMETFSRSMLEAEAYGLPIVSTSCCGVSEQVVWGENALHFDSDDAAALAAHLDRLLEDGAFRRAAAAKSRALFENHLSYDEMLDRYGRALWSAARHGPRPAELTGPAHPARRAA